MDLQTGRKEDAHEQRKSQRPCIDWYLVAMALLVQIVYVTSIVKRKASSEEDGHNGWIDERL